MMKRFEDLSPEEKRMHCELQDLKDRADELGNENLAFHLDIALRFLKQSDDKKMSVSQIH